ncbi:hypothetical protein [Desulfovibrio legallii]|jgi:hypothetical protein|uniref:Uncharacterized protein n=1 Tax=Desulfovibrio legallii TaxID=571438 RepID=A0A1G7I378_9BACT|nr:hypothetical protein [Desulfovibrio legallii]SDF07192.1 hypothetical protein SAMN05192586_101138 [Desulfovibrio legallii]
MKIQNEQLEALLRQQELAARTDAGQKSDGNAFAAALAEQMGLGEDAAAAVPASGGQTAQASLISQMLLTDVSAAPAAGADAAAGLEDAVSQAAGTLDMWESYVQTLGAGDDASLKDAYALLQGIDGQVAALKDSTANLRGQNAGFDSLVNELEVLATTEKVKFNRGDYLA